MSNETLLFICGIILAVSAVTVSFIGLRVKSFPGKAMPLVVLWFAIFVVGSTTFAVLHAKDEEGDKAKEARYEKAGKEYEKAAGDVSQEESGGESGEGEGHSEEGAEEEGAEESPEAAEEGAEEEGESEGGATQGGGGAGAEEGGTKEGAMKEGGAEGETGEGSTKEAAAGDPAAGEMVFAENCAVCHGPDGHGGGGGPDLRTMPKAQEEATAIEQVTDGGGGMPPFGGQLSEEEIQNVAAFVVQKVVGKG
jgi:mono/diheme cytochrome c family protein